jgi:hypothetical protein
MFIQAMTSSTYTFDEGKFISRFICDYNATIFIRCYLKERLNNRSNQIDYDTFLYEKLFDIIKKGMGM